MPRILMTRSIQFAGRALDARAEYSVSLDELRELATYACCDVIQDAPAAAPGREAAQAVPEIESALFVPARSYAKRLRAPQPIAAPVES